METDIGARFRTGLSADPRKKISRFAGRSCMDQFMVDVGDEEVFVGDEVVLIGKQGNEEITLKEVAGTL